LHDFPAALLFLHKNKIKNKYNPWEKIAPLKTSPDPQ
jgi:hypothetical protein